MRSFFSFNLYTNTLQSSIFTRKWQPGTKQSAGRSHGHPQPQADTQLLGAGTPPLPFFLNIRGFEMMISRPVRSTCPKTGLNEAGNEGRGEADGCDRAAWLVPGADGAGEGGGGSAVSSSCIHPGQTPPRAAARALLWARAHTKQAVEDDTGQPCSLSSSGHGHRTEK